MFSVQKKEHYDPIATVVIFAGFCYIPYKLTLVACSKLFLEDELKEEEPHKTSQSLLSKEDWDLIRLVSISGS